MEKKLISKALNSSIKENAVQSLCEVLNTSKISVQVTTDICATEKKDQDESFMKTEIDVLDRLLKNMFTTDEQKEEILNTFAKVQRTYNAFSRFAYLYRIKKANMQITTDLGLNPIDVSKNNVIRICALS